MPLRFRRANFGTVLIAFGAGLFLAFCFPSHYLVIILAVIVFLCGLLINRNSCGG